ncbi:MAG TPA: hypothetical protein VHA14_10640 [Bryobacteraceae bacterium]|nr:hypothetical protein [Bryobacteraceae bacterium]
MHQLTRNIWRLAAYSGGTLVVLAAASFFVHAQGLPPSAQELDVPAVLPPTVEGDWVRTDTHGSGSFDGLLKTYTQASLTPQYVGRGGGRGGRGGPGGRGGGRGGQQQADTGPHKAGEPYVVRAQTCAYGGGVQLGLEYDSEGFHMVLGKGEALVVQERGASRRIYLDGRALPSPSVRPPTGSGYSVGHIEPDGTLVVETTDATEGGVTAGGYRLADTHFIQRYIPSADGKHLTLRFEYNDPRIYAKPHTYEFTFDRMAAGSYALEEFCDATDPLNGQSIVPPEQQ